MSEKQYEILALTLRYWFVFLILYIFWQSTVLTFKDIWDKNNGTRSSGNIPLMLVLLSLSAFGLLAFRETNFDVRVALQGVLIAAIFLFQYYLIYFLFHGVDTTLILIVDTLSLCGFIMLQRLSPDIALRQVEWFAIGNVVLLFFIVFISRIKDGTIFVYPLMIAGLIISTLVYAFGETIGGARRWITIGGYTVQPSEFVKLIFVLVLSFYLNKKKYFKEYIPLFVFVSASVIIVVLQKDLGSALHYFLLFIMVYYISTSNLIITLGSLTVGVIGSIISYRIFPHVRVRVQAWKDPWADASGTGYQVAQALIAIGSGGLLGFGLGLGRPFMVPASRTDFIFAAICEELGVLVGGLIIGFYILILIKGISHALKADITSDMLLASGSTISLVIQAFIIIGGVIKLIPLTGITLPFISYGGSSILVALAMIGIIQGIAVKNYRLHHESYDPGEEGEDEVKQL